jgi:hypothetical protein
MRTFEKNAGHASRTGAGAAQDQVGGGGPGKSTLIEKAQAGILGASGPLPHADKITGKTERDLRVVNTLSTLDWGTVLDKRDPSGFAD